MMTKKRILTGCAWLALAATACLAQTPAAPAPAAKDSSALRNEVILIVRHAEKPESGMELTPAGVQRAEAYTNYFRNFTVDSKPLHLDCLIAAADSKNSHRSRLTLEPLSKSLGLPLDLRYADKQAAELAGNCKPGRTANKFSSPGTTAKSPRSLKAWAGIRPSCCPAANGRMTFFPG